MVRRWRRFKSRLGRLSIGLDNRLLGRKVRYFDRRLAARIADFFGLFPQRAFDLARRLQRRIDVDVFAIQVGKHPADHGLVDQFRLFDRSHQQYPAHQCIDFARHTIGFCKEQAEYVGCNFRTPRPAAFR